MTPAKTAFRAALILTLLAGAAPAPDWRMKVHAFAAEHFRHPAWGLSHSQRDYDLARSLAAADGVAIDDDVLFAAAFLHDQAAFKPWEDKRDHSDVAAGLVPDFLKEAGFPATKIAAVQGAIRTHMYYRDPQAPEAVYLHDADALDWLGAIGAARIMALVDPHGGDPDGPRALAMLEANLQDVPGRIVSPAGKARMPARREELARFVADLRRETSDLKTL